MIEFTSIGQFDLIKRGRIFFVSNDKERTCGNWSGLLGELVKIDGVERKIIGVESFALHTIRKGETIGLLVKA